MLIFFMFSGGLKRENWVDKLNYHFQWMEQPKKICLFCLMMSCSVKLTYHLLQDNSK